MRTKSANSEQISAVQQMRPLTADEIEAVAGGLTFATAFTKTIAIKRGPVAVAAGVGAGVAVAVGGSPTAGISVSVGAQAKA